MNSDEIFSVAIYPWTSGDSSNCVPKIKDLPIFPLYNIMTNHKNGTYSFSYERPSASKLFLRYYGNIVYYLGKISVQVYLLNPGEVHQDFYEASNLGSSLEVSTIVNYLSFDDSKTMSYGSGNYDYSVLLNSWIMFPYNGPTQLKYACENSWSIYLNEHYYTYNLGVNSIINNEIYTTVSTNAWVY